MPKTLHLRSLRQKPASFTSGSGSITRVDVDDFPVLKRLSLRRLLLSPRGVREPHWHANAHELGYCVSGDHLVTIAGSHSQRDSFTISRGQMFFVPSGALHHIENIGEQEGEMILAFSCEQVEDFGLSGTFGGFSDAVLGNTLGVPASAMAGLHRSLENTIIGARATPAIPVGQELYNNRFKYDLEAAAPPIATAGGSAHTAEATSWPILRDISMFSLRISEQGMRELHWHPETAEMGYVTAGHGRMTIFRSRRERGYLRDANRGHVFRAAGVSSPHRKCCGRRACDFGVLRSEPACGHRRQSGGERILARGAGGHVPDGSAPASETSLHRRRSAHCEPDQSGRSAREKLS